jgi:hypothetical protein
MVGTAHSLDLLAYPCQPAMVRPLRFRACVVALLWPAWACAQFLPERHYQEIVDPPTPVSGHAVVGVVVIPALQDQQSDTLWVRPGGRADSRIRVDVASANGRLHGEGTWSFKGAAAAQAWYPLTVPPKSTRPEHLAVAVQPAAPDTTTPTFLVAAWGKSAPAAVSRLRLYVNARRAEMFAYLPDGKTAVKCNALENTPTVRFDVVCDVDLPIGGAPGSAKLTLVRRDGNSTSRQPLELRW